MEIDIAVRLAFVEAGPVVLDDAGDLVFPRLLDGPGVYRLELRAADVTEVYIGEAANLRARARGYRRPNPDNVTSWRIRARAQALLSAGGSVQMLVAESATIIRDGLVVVLDIAGKAGKSGRVLAEHAALVAAVLDGEAVLNR
ncbi:MAG: hypothetical protein J0I34_33445 [Pseudonocardia sp.]|uniref:hypothetical protein n=1 Tax=Pseudonocardia sp. TaxID=60912 RepID=UPI001ACEBA2D|nr:hypothetical protein [Pseudonocardia sp.]MBN9113666.1 hypothetical protein [Pseudonocardia sp.]